MSDADIEVLPGFNRADVTYLAECLEGQHGEVRRVESAVDAAKFVRAAIALADRSATIRASYVARLRARTSER